MKHLLRLLTFVVVFVFTIGVTFAQNTQMTKSQALGLKTSNVTPAPMVVHEATSSRTVILEEGFDVDFLPTGWTQTITNPDNTWIQTNPQTHPFSEIDPNSLFSAIVPWVAADQDEWLFSPVLNSGGEFPLTLDFYAGVSGPYLNPGATLICLISDDGGATWTELWNAIDEIDPAADWAWNAVSIDITDYAFTDFQLAWQYVGNDGDLAGIDNVSVTAGYTYLFQDDMESYTVGAKLAESDQTGFWTTWSNLPGSTEDGTISDDQSLSPTKSCLIDGVNDQILKLGNKTSGSYIVNFEYYIPSTFGGYINLQHFEAPGNEWACEVYFGASAGNENGYMVVAGPPDVPFTFPHDQWFPISFVVDLDADSAWCYINDNEVAQWQFSLQADGTAGTLQLGGVDLFAGAPTGETAKYYFDNVEYIVLDPGVQSPIISVDPTSMTVFLEEGQTTNESFSITNSGQEDLIYEIMPTYPQSSKALSTVPAGAKTPKALAPAPQLAPNYATSSSQPTSRDELLHYDGDNNDAIGNNNTDYEWRVSAMFPASILQQYIGMQISEVQVYINDPAIDTKIQIYGMGSFNTPGPGELLAEQSFTGAAASWTTVTLNTPIGIDGSNLWIGYWVSSTAASFSPGVDAGPADVNGDWIAFGPGWSHLAGSGIDANWNIRATLTGTPIVQWLSTDPTSGTVVQDETFDVNVTLDATGLVSDSYTGKLLIRNNDPTNEQVDVTVLLAVTVGVTENGEKEYIAVYPNPATTSLHVQSNGVVNNITLINTVGQVVYSSTLNNAIDISNLESGVYFIKVDTDNGTTTQKVLIK